MLLGDQKHNTKSIEMHRKFPTLGRCNVVEDVVTEPTQCIIQRGDNVMKSHQLMHGPLKNNIAERGQLHQQPVQQVLGRGVARNF